MGWVKAEGQRFSLERRSIEGPLNLIFVWFSCWDAVIALSMRSSGQCAAVTANQARKYATKQKHSTNEEFSDYAAQENSSIEKRGEERLNILLSLSLVSK